jgi:hypothetical protein
MTNEERRLIRRMPALQRPLAVDIIEAVRPPRSVRGARDPARNEAILELAENHSHSEIAARIGGVTVGAVASVIWRDQRRHRAHEERAARSREAKTRLAARGIIFSPPT